MVQVVRAGTSVGCGPVGRGGARRPRVDSQPRRLNPKPLRHSQVHANLGLSLSSQSRSILGKIPKRLLPFPQRRFVLFSCQSLRRAARCACNASFRSHPSGPPTLFLAKLFVSLPRHSACSYWLLVGLTHPFAFFIFRKTTHLLWPFPAARELVHNTQGYKNCRLWGFAGHTCSGEILG